MRLSYALAAPAALLLLASCASSRFEASVTRFHLQPPALRSTVAVLPVNPAVAASLAFQTDAQAVAQELLKAGFPSAPPESADLLATVGIGTSVTEGLSRQSPVSVGIGGGTSSGNVGIGGSMQFPVGQGRSTTAIRTEMTLSLRRRVDGAVVWEGRASTSATGTPAPQTTALLARALLSGFPGPSGTTVRWVEK
jgi:hypothetical protein